MLRTIVPPGVFLGVAVVFLCILALFMPLVPLITNLTGGSTDSNLTSAPRPAMPVSTGEIILEVLLIVSPLVVFAWLISIVVRMPRTDERPLFARFVPWLSAGLSLLGVLVLAVRLATGNPDVAVVGALVALSLVVLVSAWVIYLSRSPNITALDSLRHIGEWIIFVVASMLVVGLLLVAVAVPAALVLFVRDRSLLRHRRFRISAITTAGTLGFDVAGGGPRDAAGACGSGIQRRAGTLVRRAH